VLVDGVGITARVRPRGGGCILPNDSQITKILKAIRGRLSEGSNSDVEARASKRAARQHENEAAVTQPNLRYTSTESNGSYVCFWNDDDKVVHSKRFNVPRTDGGGTMLDPGTFNTYRNKVRRKASRTWNDLDKSGQPRFDVAGGASDTD